MKHFTLFFVPKILNYTELRTITLQGEIIRYFLARTNRKSFSLKIKQTGLYVTIPRRASIRETEAILNKKHQWILTKLANIALLAQTNKHHHYTHGSVLPWLGKQLTINYRFHTKETIELNIEGNILTVDTCENREIEHEYLIKWIKTQAKAIFYERLNQISAVMGLPFSAFALSNARTIWGSCSWHNKIRLNWRLIFCELDLIEYVIIHELAHIQEKNHAVPFWALVSQYYPAYKKARTRLKQISPTIFHLFDRDTID